MINYGCFCCLNIFLNLKSSKQEGQSLNTQIFVKHLCWKKVKVKALEKSATASKSVFLCAYLHAGVQSVIHVFPVANFHEKAEPTVEKCEGGFPVTSFTALQQFRKPPSIPDSSHRLWQLWFPVDFSSALTGFSQQFYLPLLARPLLILWHYYHMVLVVCFATWRIEKKKEIVFDLCRFCDLQTRWWPVGDLVFVPFTSSTMPAMVTLLMRPFIWVAHVWTGWRVSDHRMALDPGSMLPMTWRLMVEISYNTHVTHDQVGQS